MLGFEIELLVLVDVEGRPVPEKIPLGTYGDQRVGLTIDHSSRVESVAPLSAARATSRLVPYRDGGLRLGQYDLPDGHESRYVVDAGQVDPRTAVGFTGLPHKWLEPESWPLAERALAVDGTPPWYAEVCDAGSGYPAAMRNGDVPGVVQALTSICARTGQWLAVVRPVPADDRKRRELATATATITALNAEAQAHLAYWTGQVMPPGVRQYRAADQGGATEWSTEHPVEKFLGRDTYHCILELVTRPYAVEAAAEGQALVAAVTQASQLATRIRDATNHLTARALLTAAGATAGNAQTFIGNGASGEEVVDASIQATFAVDLAQIPSLFRTLIPPIRPFSGPQGFILKHQSDVQTGGDDAGRPIYAYRAHTLACTAPDVASAILKGIAGNAGEIAEHDGLTCLRGLLTLVCQYLMMGKHFSSGAPELDKNIVPLLSRTDLAHLYRELVGPTEKQWVALHRSALVKAIVDGAGRNPDSMLFTNEAETWHGAARPPLNVTCREFVENVLEGAADGVTHHLDEGIFKEMPAEEIHPAGSALDSAPKRGPVFELRNMVPLPAWGGLDDRFQVSRWRPLAEYLLGALQALNSRTDATHDLRWFTNRTDVAANFWWV